MEKAILGGGCFWCLDAAYSGLDGVERVVSGYCGGHTADPDYKQVCSGHSGHVEVVEIHFDPARIDYATLLQVFFAVHDPTTLNRQGNDVGSQYASAIFYLDDGQRAIAERTLQELRAEQVFADPIVTRVEPAQRFYPAEGYHQGYYAQNQQQNYCQLVISPKLAKIRRRFAALMRN
ncbi:peptide-methionine (S)-S-oxide reductase MsrA [Chromobacterium subtsugae]|uniref:Peptide methionine sulfoxide reductase MsrA n=1 Tax=Chromobacterium subtsugae TaxID=251747 RepID=A0ABS7FEM7_9NEIS|nr:MULTISPECIES: peptide-methionine (S)-S-oxide reductase MsrA [Chromobacterium]KUM04838.1 methionine sulfoxide reductase A [Chromobacterium subtsugae]KZE87760.1 methionine sulfoxide reductase A [Chromobacterium sp. F49]MBW7568231.1 peptide-methionine (S)-S-oxide reductase MsrA [Chromobacterium subtsugae]MBW8288431.1 peptide-methionine (S)-S-oxide reductase MsrA [Chromobacterium subtsugae]WSE89959.1 peptide-methionine (S)-S-oxide reductase MsrA [Chromobacterium subtsugae]